MINSKKLFKTVLRGTVSDLLAAAMLLSQVNYGVIKAVDSQTKFIEKSALGSDTTYGLCTGKTPQKVYFGKNPKFDGNGAAITNENSAAQAWWIAGYDETQQTLVLLCAPKQPMSKAAFLEKDNYTKDESADIYPNLTPYNKNPNNRSEDMSWGCKYIIDGSEPANNSLMNANHYGGSDIRLKTLRDCLQANFTEAEQGLMKETEVKTIDRTNKDNPVWYTTTDKLYLATGTEGEKSIKVGSESKEFNVDLAESGPAGSPYSIIDETGNGEFWLRAPHVSYKLDALKAITGDVVFHQSFADSVVNCVPACALDTSSILFASMAKPAATPGVLDDGFYFRFEEPTEGSKIDTVVEMNDTDKELTITKRNKNVYLYIQGKDGEEDWVYSKLINNIETLTANDIHTGLTNFSNCKAWLEASEDNVTYAKEIDLSSINTIKLISKYDISIRLKDEFGRMITDTKGIALKLGGTSMNKDGNGVFTLNNLTDGSYTLTVTIDENTSDYLAPEKSTFEITKGGNESASTATLSVVVKLQKKEIEVGRVLTGIGGEAGYKYNRKTGKTKFYCSPYPGYKLDKILKGTDGKTEYVSFKII